MKAIKITAENQQMLGARYQVDDPEDIFPIGYYIVAPFGTTDTNEEFYEGIVTLAWLNENYNLGEVLDNGYFGITEK